MKIVEKIIAKSAEEAFHKILNALKNDGIESKPRGYRIREILDANIVILNPRDRLITCPERRTSIAYALGELSWYMSGRNDVATMEYYSKFMKNMSDDGETLNSAYGYRIFGHHKQIGFDQLKNVVDLLMNDKDSRQAVIHLHTPNNKKTKDEVCTMCLQFLIRNDKLDMITTMRSNDVVLGFTYDVFAFTCIQELIAERLGVEVGTYYHNAGSMHVYLDGYYGNGSLDNILEKHTYSPIGEMAKVSDKIVKYIMKIEEEYRTKQMSFERMKEVNFNNAYVFADNYIRDSISNLRKSTAGGLHKNLILAESAFLLKFISKTNVSKIVYQQEVLNILGDNGYENELNQLMDSTAFTKGGYKVIVDGIDKAGKTTLVKKIKSNLEKKGSAPLVRHYAKASESFRYFLNYSHELLSNIDEVVDRFFFSEIIYGAEIRKQINIDEIGYSLLVEQLKLRNVKVIFIVPKDTTDLKKRMTGTEDEWLVEYVDKINESYGVLAEELKSKGIDVEVVEDGCKYELGQ